MTFTIYRVWWIFAFALSTVLCGFLIHNVWNKWEHSPVIVTFDENPTPAWQIPFPAVTICPVTKTYWQQFNFTDVFNSLKNKEFDKVTEEE